MKRKKMRTSYINIYNDEEFALRLLLGEFDTAIKKGKMKIKRAYEESNEEVVPTVSYEDFIIKEEPVKEVAVLAPKSTDLELAIQSNKEILNGSIPNMKPEYFTAEVWAEAWLIVNGNFMFE